MYSDRQALANSVDPDELLQNGLQNAKSHQQAILCSWKGEHIVTALSIHPSVHPSVRTYARYIPKLVFVWVSVYSVIVGLKIGLWG